jgi:hypothetical protein
MHGIKYFFLNKNNQTIQGGKKNFQGEHVPKTLPKNTIFQNPEGVRAPWILLGPPLDRTRIPFQYIIAYRRIWIHCQYHAGKVWHNTTAVSLILIVQTRFSNDLLLDGAHFQWEMAQLP